MLTLVKQTIIIFLVLVLMCLAGAGVCLAIIKAKPPLSASPATIADNSTVVSKDDLPEVKVDKEIITPEIKVVPVVYEEDEKEEEASVPEEDPVLPVSQPVVDKPSSATGEIVLHNVPFTPQAPYGDWSDPRQDAGCEEAALLMAVHWITGEPLTPSIALKQITTMADYQLEHYGHFHDSSLADTLKLFNDYFGYTNAFIKYGVTIEDIKAQIKAGRVVALPVNGIILDNPYFTPPGPPVHQILAIGYDDTTGELIAHDPGTKRGKNFRFSYSNIEASLGDYLTGHNEPMTLRQPGMLVIGKNQ